MPSSVMSDSSSASSSTASSTASSIKAAPLRMLSCNERLRLNSSGLKVLFVVGYQQKVYSLSKAIVAKYSPVLEKLANEAKGSKVFLPADKVEDFDVLYDLIYKGIAPGTANQKPSIAGNKATIAICLAFLETAEKYELGDPTDILYDTMHKSIQNLSYHKTRNNAYAMGEAAKLGLRCGIDGSDIEAVFERCPAGSRLRGLIAQAALSYSGVEDLKPWEEEMNEIPDFGKTLMEQCVSGFAKQNFTDPFTKHQKRVQPRWRN